MGVDGFAIYSRFSVNGLNPPDIYNTSNLFSQQPDISDIEYSPKAATLFVLDRAEGLK